jgi:hypothetical protein
MAFEIRMGLPEMGDVWNDLKQKHREGTASKQEEQLYKKWGNILCGIWCCFWYILDVYMASD